MGRMEILDSKRLAYARAALGLTQAALAEQLDVDVRTYRRYESGEVNHPTRGLTQDPRRRRLILNACGILGLEPADVVRDTASRSSLDALHAAVERGERPVILFEERSDFNDHISRMVTAAGATPFHLRLMTGFDFRRIRDIPFDRVPLVVMPRDETWDLPALRNGAYPLLARYVRRGGTLLAASWIAYDVGQDTTELGDVLPCANPTRQILENEVIDFQGADPLLTSLECVIPRFDAVVSLRTPRGQPLLTHRDVERGRCIYLACSQHSCTLDLPSPLEHAVVREQVRRLVDEALAA